MKTTTFAFTLALALCGAAQAQSTGGTDNGTPGSGTLSTDTNGSSTMPAEVVPPSVLDSTTSSSGTSGASGSPRLTPEYRMPTRNEVRTETAAMVRSGTIPHGELSTAFQDKGAQIGSTPF